MSQKTFRFTLPLPDGQPRYLHVLDEREFNNPKTKVAPDKLFSDLLKRQARRVMADVTECPPDTLPAHLARLDDLSEIIRHAMRHDFAESREALESGYIGQPSTLADYLACLKITRKQHRCPSFVNQRDKDIAEIKHKLDTLAGLFAQSSALETALREEVEA